MEILKNFVFDLQRHAAALATGSATITTKTEINGPSADGVYYYKIDDTTKNIVGSYTTSPAANTSYLRVTLNGTTYTLDTYTTNASGVATSTSGVTFSSGVLTFISGVQDATLTTAAGSSDQVVLGGAVYASVPSGGSVRVTATGSAVMAAENSLFKINNDHVNATVESGSAYLNYNGSLDTMWAKAGGESVQATTGSVVLSYDGKVSSLDAGDVFRAADSATSGFTYTVDSIGGAISLTSNMTSYAGPTKYLLTSDVAQTVVTLSNDKNVDTFSNTIAVTGSSGGLYAAGAGASAAIDMSSQGTAHAYLTSGGEVRYTGYTNDSFGKYLGSITPDNNGNYAFDGSSSTIAESITGSADANITTILSGSGNDSINAAGYTAKAVTINAGAGNDTVDAAVFTGSSILGGTGSDRVNATVKGSAATIDLGDGNNTLLGGNTGGVDANEWTIVGGSGNDSVDLSALTTKHSYWNVNVGDGDNVVALANGVTFSTVVSGSGNDTITSYAANNSLVGGSGKDVFDIDTAGKAANISDYEYGADVLLVNAATDAGANTIAKTATAAGVITGAGTATISGSGDVFAVTITDANSNKVDIGWTGENGTSIDASSVTRKAVLVGTTNEVGDTLVGGSKADTIYAGASDSVYGGAGNDLISINDAKTYGVYVGFSTAGGKDTVQNFSTGWDIASADEVYVLDESSVASLQGGITGSDVTLKSGTATMTLSNAANGKSEVQALVNDKKVDLIKENTIINVTDDSTLADYYIGTTKSGISLSKYTSDVEVNLANNMFRNITTVEGGAGSTSILGGKAAESLKGGTGDSSLYGGAGVDTLVSGDGKTTFFATAESGKDVVTGFVVGADDTSDVLNVSSIAGVTRSSGTNFTLKVDNSNSLNVSQKSGGVNSNIQWVSGEASGVAKIGITGSNNNFSYDTATTNYVGGTKTDTVSLTSGTTDNFNVWLDQTGGMFSSIEVYDLKNTSGDVLLAGKADTKETIIGGQSNTSLWGGAGNTVDVLKSTSGSTTDFFYGLGEGNDSISGSAKDTVNLYNINLSDITKADINSGSVVFTTTANNTVSVSGSVGTFKLADGTAWTANYSNKTWSAAE